MDSSRRNLEAYPPTLTVSLHQFEQQAVFPSVIGETLDALELVALAVSEAWGRHAACLSTGRANTAARESSGMRLRSTQPCTVV